MAYAMNNEQRSPGSTTGKAIAAVKLVFTPIAVGCLLFVAWRSRDTLEALLVRADGVRLFTSAVLWAALHTISPVFSTRFFRAVGGKVSYGTAWMIHATRLPAKYLPGGVWHTAARLSDFHGHGLQGNQLAAFAFLENVLALCVTLGSGGLLMAISLVPVESRMMAIGAAIVAAIGWFATYRVANRLVRRLGIKIEFNRFADLTAVVVLFWVVATLSFLSYVSAFDAGLVRHSAIKVAGAYLVSWAVGFVAIFAPQGIGVFELVASLLINLSISAGGAVALFAGFRVIMLIGDAMIWLASVIMRVAFPVIRRGRA